MGRIPRNHHFAVGVGTDGCQGHPFEIIFDFKVKQQKIVFQSFFKLCELFTFSKSDRRQIRVGRERVAKNIVDINPWKTIGVDLLENDPGRDPQIFIRLDGKRQASTVAAAIIHIIIHRKNRIAQLVYLG